MTVMDIKAPVLLSTELVQLALAFQRTTMAHLKSSGDCAFGVISQHYDLAETAARVLCSSKAAVVEFMQLCELPDVDDYLK